MLHALLPIGRVGIIRAKTNQLRFFLSLLYYESDAMLFKKIATVAAIATTLAFVGCAKKQEAAPAASEATAAASEATAAASEAAATASEATVAASEATAAAASQVDAAPVASQAAH